MKHYILMPAVAMLLSAVSFTAHAETAKAAPAKSAIDANNDGVISKVEADAVAGRDFASFDTNKDGNISKDEFKTLLFKVNAKAIPDEATKKKAEPEIEAQYKNLDLNKDGTVSKAEFMEDSTRRFKAMDENGDGSVSKAEVTDVQNKIRAQLLKMKAAAEAKKK